MNSDPYYSAYKSKKGLRRLVNALKYSLQGLRAAFKYEASFRQELVLALVLIPIACWWGDNAIEILILIVSVGLVLVIELINSAIEVLADAISLENHPLLGRAKDLASAAVSLTLLLMVVVWAGIAIAHNFY